jgi:copper(I)-binding protein
MNLAGSLVAGEELEITLQFENAGEMSVTVEIREG